MNSLLSKAEYYFGWYNLRKEVDNLCAASAFLSDFIRAGGNIELEIVKKIQESVKAILGEEKEVKVSPQKTEIKEIENEPLIFGYTYAQIGFMQGSKTLK